jgi:hypothetical protein
LNSKEREKMVLDYIEANPRCTKTKVKDSMPFATRTTDKILKKLIEEDKKVIYEIDKGNSRIHHLLINQQYKTYQRKLQRKSAMLSQLLGPFTTVQLTTGEWISTPVLNRKFPIMNANVLDEVRNLIAGSKWY